MSKYYYLVAGLPELTLEEQKLTYTVDTFKSEIYPELSPADQQLIQLFYLKFDHANILKLLRDREAPIGRQGNYSAEELLDILAQIKDGEIPNVKYFPKYLSQFLVDYYQAALPEAVLLEDHLATRYYHYAMQCGNPFVSTWFEFNLHVNNILTALTARKYKWEVAKYVLGETDVCEALRTSNARDFGLSGEVDYWDQLSKIHEQVELVDREKRLDLLRWSWMESATFFNYFTIEPLFVFLLKLEMVERWMALDKERGDQLFRSMIDGLKNQVQIPAEFK